MKTYTRKEFLKTMGGAVTAVGIASALPVVATASSKNKGSGSGLPKKPNILLITTDTQRCDTIKAMGYDHSVSPNLDKLIQEGVMFRNGHTSSPVCSPARTSLLTGVHTPIHGCIENGIDRRTDLITLPDLLKEQGYTNIMVGKTHFGPVPDSFQVQKVLTAGKKGDANDIYGKYIKKLGFSRKSVIPNPIPPDQFMDSFLAETAIDEMKKVVSSGKDPFFAHCSMPSPHPPLDPPGEYATMFDDVEFPPLNYTNGDFKKLPQYLIDHLDLKDPGELDMEAMDAKRRAYYGLAAYCDAQVGKLINFLDESGIRENTLVIFTSDHGTTFYDHGLSNKHHYYDESWRVPFILSMPGTLPQGEERDFAIWNDITTSILAASGTSCDTMQGYDIYTPIAAGAESPRNHAVSAEYHQIALATSSWKIVYYYEQDTGQLFDRKNDPAEQINLYDNPEYSEIKSELQAALLGWRGDLSDLEVMRKRTSGGGRVAGIASKHTHSMSALDSEIRLSKKVEQIENRQ